MHLLAIAIITQSLLLYLAHPYPLLLLLHVTLPIARLFLCFCSTGSSIFPLAFAVPELQQHVGRESFLVGCFGWYITGRLDPEREIPLSKFCLVWGVFPP